MPNPVVPADDGQSLIPYLGADAGQITVGGELNKLAHNIALGRDMAGVHWRSETGTTHSFASFEDVVTEVDNARIFGGMHFHHSVKEGNRLGRRVADYILANKFCRAADECGGDGE